MQAGTQAKYLPLLRYPFPPQFFHKSQIHFAFHKTAPLTHNLLNSHRSSFPIRSIWYTIQRETRGPRRLISSQVTQPTATPTPPSSSTGPATPTFTLLCRPATAWFTPLRRPLTEIRSDPSFL